MTEDPARQVLRLPKRHDPKRTRQAGASDGARLVAKQSLRNAMIAAIVVVAAFTLGLTLLSMLARQLYPWLTILLGMVTGLAIRRAGHGLDWRFPTLAAAATLAGAALSNVVVSAAFTASELDASIITILARVTSMTWPVYLDEVVTAADVIYALFAAGIAAFYANRRLDRGEFAALRKWKQEHER